MHKSPAIWQNGGRTLLWGLVGDHGIQATESIGLAMNNKGEVVGHSFVYLKDKNGAVYTEMHAAKWVNGQAIDLHYTTSATAINDNGDILIGDRWIRSDGTVILQSSGLNKATNKNYLYNDVAVLDLTRNSVYHIDQIKMDSIWMTCTGFKSVNDSGVIVAQGKTVDGKEHAMLLTPVTSD